MDLQGLGLKAGKVLGLNYLGDSRFNILFLSVGIS